MAILILIKIQMMKDNTPPKKDKSLKGKVDLSSRPTGHKNMSGGGPHKDKREKRKGNRRQQNDENIKEE